MKLFFGHGRNGSAKAGVRNPGDGLVTANALFGDKVVNLRNETLGTVTELLLDAPLGRIAYAVVATGGFMGVGEQFFVIPWNAFVHDVDNRRLVVDADRQTLAGAPAFDREHRLSELDAQWHLALHRHYGSRPYWE